MPGAGVVAAACRHVCKRKICGGNMKKSGFLCVIFALAMILPCPGIDIAPDSHVDISWLAGRGVAHAADAGQLLEAIS